MTSRPKDDGLSLQDFLPDGAAAGPDGKARAGSPLAAGEAIAPRDAIVEALQAVYDPEISVNIYDLGLIYGIDQAEDGTVKIDMTLTAPTCPVAGILPMQVAQAAAAVAGVGEVEVTLVWDPPWSKDHMSDDARFALDMF
jgi:FeS assembly SUF system protein